MDEDVDHSTERYRNESIASLENYQECVTRNMSDKERNVLKNVTREFNQYRFSYMYDSVQVVEQPREGYNELLREAEHVNDDRCECLKYRKITRYPEVGWTVYARDSICPVVGGACQLQKRGGCESGTVGVVLGFLFGCQGLFLAAFIVVSVLVLRRVKKTF